jgi:hypothetical protein
MQNWIKPIILGGILVMTNSLGHSQPVIQECDILIVGGGLGGCAAAMQASDMAEKYGIARIIMTEETDWLGGQYTSQAVTATDPNSVTASGNYFGGSSELYFKLHEKVRDYFRPTALKTAAAASTRNGGSNSLAYKKEVKWINGTTFSPGNAWGSRMAFPPKYGVMALNEMLGPHLKSKRLSIYYQTIPIKVDKSGNQVTSVMFKNQLNGKEFTIKAKMILDATELGDLLPLSGTAYRLGIDATDDTKEPSLYDDKGNAVFKQSYPGIVQSFTYPFVVEWCAPGEDHRLPWESRPASYEQNKHRFSLDKRPDGYLMTRPNEWMKSQGKSPRSAFWTYRRILDAMILDPQLKPDLYPKYQKNIWVTEFNAKEQPDLFIPNDFQTNVGDLLEVNWGSNDYYDRTIIDVTPEERDQSLKEAKELALGFLYYLWYELPRDPKDPRLDPADEKNWSVDPATGKNTGYSNLKLRPDVLDTKDGLSKYPYIRESRRVRPLFTIRQQDVMGPASARAKLFPDTVGIGHYYMMDLHQVVKHDKSIPSVRYREVVFEDGTKGRQNNDSRFQIPLGALIPEKTDSLLMACKNLGVTHLTNGCYRLHPVEFQIGQAAGVTAVLSVANKQQPRDFWTGNQTSTPSVNELRLHRLQNELLNAKVPLFWNLDCGWNDKDFQAVQWVCLLNLITPDKEKFYPKKPFTRREAVLAAYRFVQPADRELKSNCRFKDIPLAQKELINAARWLDQKNGLEMWLKGDKFDEKVVVSQRQFMRILNAALGEKNRNLEEYKPMTRVEAARVLYQEIVLKYQLGE